MSLDRDQLQARAARIRLLLLDVDGVLTDGTVLIHGTRGESKRFFIRDGLALVWAKRLGLEVGFLSGRPSETTSRRATELGVQIVVQGGTDKQTGYEAILDRHGFTDTEVAYMADDLLDLPVLARAGLSTAPADAADEVRSRVHWVSRHPGGHGAVRELVELLLRAQARWDALVDSYLA